MNVAGNIIEKCLLVPYAIDMDLLIYYVSRGTIMSCYMFVNNI